MFTVSDLLSQPASKRAETPPRGLFARLRLGRHARQNTPDGYNDASIYDTSSTITMRFVGNPLLLTFLTVLGFSLMSWFAVQLVKEVRQLRAATIEDIEWSLNETEVEFLSYQFALRQTLNGAGGVSALQRDFAIFANRIESLRFGSLYEPLRALDGFEDAADQVTDLLDQSSALLYEPKGAVLTALPSLEEQVIAMAPHVRAMAAAGQNNLDVLLDTQLLTFSDTLKLMGFISFVLMTSLGLLAFYFNQLRRQSEARRRSLLAAGKRTRAVLATSLDAVIVSNDQGIIQEFNEAACETFGYSRDQAIGQAVADLLVPDEHVAAHLRGMTRVRGGGGFHMVGKGRVRIEAKRADGTVFPVEMALQKSDSRGQRMYIAFARDISYRVRAERELIEARDQARAGEKAKSRFLAVMSHEIRTPMNGILGNMSLLRETKLNREQDGFLSKMESSGDLLLSHVNDVLDIARYEEGKPVVRFRPTRLREVIDSAVESQRAEAEAKGNSLTLIFSGPKRGWVRTDPGRVQQILLNLLSNAIKFTDDGSIIVDVRFSPSGHDVEIRVKDDGMGIAETDLDRIFEDFFAQDDSFARKTEGTGLGLGIVRRVSDALGGTVAVSSQIGTGTTFTVQLPMPDSEPPEDEENLPTPAVEEAADQNTTDMLSVLVVEDNQINRDVVRAMLTREGHLVEEAHDGQSGVELASQKQYDLILMDISMPVLDGREATRAIRSGQGASARSPIVALTAHVLPENVNEFMGLGMQDVLPKPLMRPDLQRIIRDYTRAANRDSCPSAVLPTGLSELIDRDTNLALRESVGEAYDMLLDKMCEELTELSDWLSTPQCDLTEVGDRCHKHAASAAVFGALPLQKLLVEIELAAKDGDAAQVAADCANVPLILQHSLRQLRAKSTPKSDSA